ncbi:MAG: glycosyltransferase [Pseudomonadota bacterium]
MTAPEASRFAFLGFHNGPGGIGRVIINLANGMAAQGHQVDLLFARPGAHDAPQLDPTVGIHIIGGRKGLSTLPGLLRYLRKHRPAVLMTNKEWANQVAFVANRIGGVGVPNVIRVGTVGSAALAQRGALKRRLRAFAMRLSYGGATRFIANSSGVRNDLVGNFGVDADRVDVIFNPIIPPEIEELAAAQPDHPWLRQADIPVLVAVGRLVEPKDYPTLLRAFAHVKARRPCRLVILGEGQKRAELENLAGKLDVADDLAMPGFTANPFGWYAQASLFVLSSKREGFPNVIAESLATGAPVVATDCHSGPREILADGRYGRLVPVGDDHALAAAILDTLDAPPDRQHQRSGATEFTRQRGTRHYLESFARCLEKPGEND